MKTDPPVEPKKVKSEKAGVDPRVKPEDDERKETCYPLKYMFEFHRDAVYNSLIKVMPHLMRHP